MIRFLPLNLIISLLITGSSSTALAQAICQDCQARFPEFRTPIPAKNLDQFQQVEQKTFELAIDELNKQWDQLQKECSSHWIQQPTCFHKTMTDLLPWIYKCDLQISSQMFKINQQGIQLQLAHSRYQYDSLVNSSGEVREQIAKKISSSWSATETIRRLKAELDEAKNLTLEENTFLNLYRKSIYRELNAALRDDQSNATWRQLLGLSNTTCVQLLVEKFNHGLSKLPIYRGNVWRGLVLNETDLNEYSQNKILNWPAYTSTSAQEDIAQTYSDPRRKEGKLGVIFKINIRHNSCHDISGTNPGYEILCLPGTKVRVIRKSTQFDRISNSTKTVVELEDVP